MASYTFFCWSKKIPTNEGWKKYTHIYAQFNVRIWTPAMCIYIHIELMANFWVNFNNSLKLLIFFYENAIKNCQNNIFDRFYIHIYKYTYNEPHYTGIDLLRIMHTASII